MQNQRQQPDTSKTGIYLRKSTTEGSEQAIDAQRHTVHEWLEGRGEDATVAHEYVDVLSAYDERLGRRPGWQDLEDDLRTGRIDRIVCRHVDRVYRHLSDLQSVIDLFEDTKVTFQTAWSGDIDLESASGKTTARILGAVSMGEVEELRRRTKEGIKQKRAAGSPSGGQRPFGWQRSGEQVEAEVKAIKKSIKGIIENGDSISKVARDWTEQGFTSTRGGVITPQAVTHCLRSPRLYGMRIYKGQPQEADWYEAILTRKEFNALQAVLDDPARQTYKGDRKSGRKAQYLMSGLLQCGICGATCRASSVTAPLKDGSRKQYLLYRCVNRCVSIHRHIADDMVSLSMTRVWLRGNLLELAPTADLGQRMSKLVKGRKKLEKKKSKYVEMHNDGVLTLKEFSTVMKKASKKDADLAREYDSVARKFALATDLASPVVDGTVNLNDAAALLRRFQDQGLDLQRRQVAEAYTVVLRPDIAAQAHTFIVNGEEHTEYVPKDRKQERRLLFTSKLSDALSFDPVEEDVAEQMSEIAGS